MIAANLFCRILYAFLLLFLSLLIGAERSLAAPFAIPELRICSQNLHRYGESARKGARYKDQRILESFIERISQIECDVIALQEVFGRTQKEAQQTLRNFREVLEAETGVEYQQFIGTSNDPYIRNGFLLAQGAAEIVSLKSFADHNLPLLRKHSAAHKFSRGPLLLHLRVAKKERARKRDLLIFNLHFKSKHNSWKDPARIQYEDLRMEMAEGLREIALTELKHSAKDAILLILGDRNSSIDSASAQIFYGSYQLNDFSREGICALDKRLQPTCKKGFKERKKVLISLFYPKSKKLKVKYSSYQYRKQHYLLDDILVRPKDRRYFLGKNKQLRAGLIGEFSRTEELDHRMAWAELNF